MSRQSSRWLAETILALEGENLSARAAAIIDAWAAARAEAAERLLSDAKAPEVAAK